MCFHEHLQITSIHSSIMSPLQVQAEYHHIISSAGSLQLLFWDPQVPPSQSEHVASPCGHSTAPKSLFSHLFQKEVTRAWVTQQTWVINHAWITWNCSIQSESAAQSRVQQGHNTPHPVMKSDTSYDDVISDHRQRYQDVLLPLSLYPTVTQNNHITASSAQNQQSIPQSLLQSQAHRHLQLGHLFAL